MSKLMMDAIDRVFSKVLGVIDIEEAADKIDMLNDEERIDLLDALIEATMNYHDQYRGPGRSSPIVPLIPSNKGGEMLTITWSNSTDSEASTATVLEQLHNYAEK